MVCTHITLCDIHHPPRLCEWTLGWRGARVTRSCGPFSTGTAIIVLLCVMGGVAALFICTVDKSNDIIVQQKNIDLTNIANFILLMLRYATPSGGEKC